MPIKYIRLYFEEGYNEKILNLAHFGWSIWIDTRLKKISSLMKGPEAVGANIVNFVFIHSDVDCADEDVTFKWEALLDVLFCNIDFNNRTLDPNDPIANIRRLTPIMARAAKNSSWPQIKVIGSQLLQPIAADDEADILKALKKWQDKVADAVRKTAN
jgi:hypothetical protein